MKKSFSTLFISALLALSGLCAHAGEVTSQAIVSEVTGNPSVAIPGQQSFVPKVGDKLPQGTTIETGAGGSIVIQAFTGAYAKIVPNSSASLEKLSVTTADGAVTKQTAMINLKVGTILNAIDPANHNINDYAIRTPQGVAAARGTAYGVTVQADGTVHVFVSKSQVTFTNPATGQKLTVPANTEVVVKPDGTIQTELDFVVTTEKKGVAGFAELDAFDIAYGHEQTVRSNLTNVNNGTKYKVDPSLSNASNRATQSASQ